MTSITNTAAVHSSDSVAASIVGSRVVVAEFVERAFATGRAPLLEDANLDALERAVDRKLQSG